MAAAPDQVRTESNGPIGTSVAIVLMVLTIFFTSLRFFTRTTILKAIGKDDWAVLVATAFCFCCAVATCFEVKYGMGRHIENVTPAEIVEQMRFLMVAIYAYNMGMHSVKLGFLFQYRRIFRTKAIQTICFWFILYVCVWAVVQTVLSSLTCIPVAIVYPAMADKCLNALPIWYITAGMSMVTDLAIFCIPLHSVWKLQLPLRQKIMVMGIFCLGFFVCILSIYRMFTLEGAAGSLDPTWDNISAAIWSLVELGVSIIVSSLPTLRPLLSRLLPGLGFSTNSDRRDRSSYYMRHDGGGSAEDGGRRGTACAFGLNKLITTTVATAPSRARSSTLTTTLSRARSSTLAEGASTEDSALERTGHAGGGGGGYYAGASSECDRSANVFASEDPEKVGRIMMTTEITVDSGSR
ncbi:hypothetical protein RB595_006207 [Gaeumannomyces hyphopodioides]